jgi:hypothetical protein
LSRAGSSFAMASEDVVRAGRGKPITAVSFRRGREGHLRWAVSHTSFIGVSPQALPQAF